MLYFANFFNKKKRLELQPTNCAHPVKLAVDAAAEDLQIEENFVCEFGALFRHRSILFLRTGRLIDFYNNCCCGGGR